MKYNKKEKQAIDALLSIATALKAGERVEITNSDICAIKNVLGINLFAITTNKTESNKIGYKRGKESCLLNYSYYNRGYKDRNCFFPFQLKS